MKEQTGKKPVAAPTASIPAVVLALVFIAAGVILGREALLVFGAISGPEWVLPAAQSLDGLTAQDWMLPAGIAALIVGLALVVVALGPRRRTHRPLETADVWLRKDDVAAIARAAALDSTGVDTAGAKARARTVKVTVTSATGDDSAELKNSVAKSVETALHPLESAPKVRTKVRSTGSAS